MAKGRKPQPAEVKAAKGNPGRRKNIVVSKDVAPLAGLNPPAEMTGPVATVWKELVPGMVALGFLR